MNTNEMICRINEIQKIAYSRHLTRLEKAEWRNIQNMLRVEGYKIAHEGKYWKLKSLAEVQAVRDARFECEWLNKDMSPSHKHLKGNCTTRALCYVLDRDYDEIENEQYRLSEEYGGRRNTHSIWTKILTKNGWTEIRLNKPTRCDIIAKRLALIESPMFICSSAHVAVIEYGYLVDSWDSRGKKAKSLIIKNTEIENVRKSLGYALRD